MLIQRFASQIARSSRTLRRAWRRLLGINERCITLAPCVEGAAKGRVLFSYIIDAALVKREADLPYSHPHFWESWAMIQCFREAGYIVDVIHWTRRRPLPRTDYDIYVDVRRNFDRYSAVLPDSCFKIAHMDTAHYATHNRNQHDRLAQLKARRRIELPPFKLVEANQAAEQADLITVLGNAFTMDTYRFAGKPIVRIPLSNAFEYPIDETKDFAAAKNRFIWLGSEGFIHKGLDLVLEAFAGLPDHHLLVCGPLDSEPDFVRAFHDLLFETPNITVCGWVDVGGDTFRKYVRQCVGTVYPSCSEGGGGCVITLMHAGLIPIVTYEASVDLDPDSGICLTEASVASIQQAVRDLSARSPDQLAAMSQSAVRRVRAHHSRAHFRQAYRELVDSLPARRSDSLSKENIR